jgi:flagellar hook-associated protein 3 FlgL
MIDNVSSSDARFLAALEKIQSRMERAQRELASGKRIFAPSDEPDGISALLSVRSELESMEQSRLNLGRTKAEVDAAENGLQSAVKILERARVLSGQAQSGFNDDPTWQALEQEASDLTQQLLNVSNLAIEGRFIFAGNSDLTQPFTFDPNTGSVNPYAGSAATRQSLFPGGNPFSVARSGEEIFDSQNPGESAFAALRELETTLAARDVDAVRNAMVNIESALKHLSGQLSSYGAIQRRVYEASSAAESTTLRLQTQLARLEEADATQSIIDLQQAEFQQRAALQTRGSMPKTSLFDYLA